jgi:N-methylhydantoinase B
MRSDPITFEVVRNALIAATDEMVVTLRRSAYSTNIKTRADFSCAFFDEQLRAVAQGFNQPVHLGSMVQQVPRAVLDYGPENLGAGDVIVTNDPYPSGVHLNDVSLVSPVHADGELLGYVANLAHHVDVGGGAPASIGAFREVFQEGVIIPPVKLVERGEIVEDVFALLLAQIRSKHETAGDLRAQVAANATGVRRVQAFAKRHGLDVLRGVMDEVLAYTERRGRAELARLPHGSFEAEGQVDTDGYTDDPVRLRARIEISGDGVAFDLSGCDPERRAPVNSTFAQTFSACAYALKCLVDPDLPVNDGFYRLLRVQAPAGSVVNCNWPSPVVGGWETQTRLVDVVFRALLPALPDRLPAGTKAMMCHAGFGGVDAETGEYTCFLETLGGGYGGRAGSDGPDAVQAHGQNTENAPVEETERGYPVRVDRLSLVEDSDGPGRFRGGLGLRKDYSFDRPLTFTVLADRTREGPWGVLGGGAGAPARFVLLRDGVERELNPKSTIDLLAGDVVSYRTCGGGGYGPAAERDPALVARDVREGKVSHGRARDVYRVALEPSGRVDEAATAAIRAKAPKGRGLCQTRFPAKTAAAAVSALDRATFPHGIPIGRIACTGANVDESVRKRYEGHLTENGV